MTTEQLIRDQLERATRTVPGGPDVETAIRSGRRRRLLRRGGLAVAAVAVLGLGATGLHAVTDGDDGTVVHDTGRQAPLAGAPAAPTDYVPGTDIDEKLAAIVAQHLPGLPAPDDVYPSDSHTAGPIVAQHLPGLPAPDDVYPSDSHTAGPIADADWASAEDWQATYTENGNQVLVITGLPSEGPDTCGDCPSHQVPGGYLFREDSSSIGDDGRTRWYFGTFFARDDGTFTNAWEIVRADDKQVAEGMRHVTNADLAALVQDPGLTFAGLGAVAP